MRLASLVLFVLFCVAVAGCNSINSFDPDDDFSPTLDPSFATFDINETYFANSTFVVDNVSPPVQSINWSSTDNVLAISAYDLTQDELRVYLLEIDTQRIIPLLNQFHPNGFQAIQAWSPDGEQLIFWNLGVDADNIDGGIWLVNIDDDNNPVFLAQGFRAGWSHGGNLAIMEQNKEEGEISISVMSSLQSVRRRLLTIKGVTSDGLSWSPDSSKIIFTMLVNIDDSEADIFVLDVNTSKVIKITNDGNNHDSTWSPTRNLIAYVNRNFISSPPLFELHIMKPNGTCDIFVPDLGDVFDPTWSPDGRQIAYIGFNGIFLVDLVEVFGDAFHSEDFPCNILE